ncbi:glycosyltransferase family 39 protein [Chloroflexus sp.]|uniref:glycosyltransferase family 39 protein n=1 Tax=Chloroflexus sp. TaxID=1904827 RepID=UPI00404A83FD
MYRPEPSPLTLTTGGTSVTFTLVPGIRFYRVLLRQADQPVAITTALLPTSEDETRALGVALFRVTLERVTPVTLLDVFQSILWPPFFSLAILGLFLTALITGHRHYAGIAPVVLVGTVLTGLIWPAQRLDAMWISTNLCLVIFLGGLIYRLTKLYPALRLRNDYTAGAVLLGAGVLTIMFTFFPVVRWDGAGYYAYARALVYRGDLVMDETFVEYFPSAMRTLQKTDRGLVANPWSVGPAIVWIGPLAVYRLLYGGNGHDEGALATVCLISAWAGVGTMMVAYRCARRWYSPAASAVGAAGAFYGSTLWYYSMREGGFAHAISAFACALAVLAWLRLRERDTLGRWVAFGAAAGLVVLTYWATALLLIAPAIGIIFWAGSARHRWPGLLRIGGMCLLAAGVALLVFSPQMGVWYLIYGSPITKPPTTPSLVLSESHIVDLLFARFGLARWTPLAMVGLIGLFLVVRRNAQFGIALIVAAGVYVVYNGMLSDWHGSGAFGTRRLTSLAAWYALGLAAITDALLRYRRSFIALVGFIAGVWWMLMLLVRNTMGILPFTDYFSLETMSATELYLGPTALPVLLLGDFLHSSFVLDMVRAPLTYSITVGAYLGSLSLVIGWVCWRWCVRGSEHSDYPDLRGRCCSNK